jgi:hypothetical protein
MRKPAMVPVVVPVVVANARGRLSVCARARAADNATLRTPLGSQTRDVRPLCRTPARRASTPSPRLQSAAASPSTAATESPACRAPRAAIHQKPTPASTSALLPRRCPLLCASPPAAMGAEGAAGGGTGPGPPAGGTRRAAAAAGGQLAAAAGAAHTQVRAPAGGVVIRVPGTHTIRGIAARKPLGSVRCDWSSPCPGYGS